MCASGEALVLFMLSTHYKWKRAIVNVISCTCCFSRFDNSKRHGLYSSVSVSLLLCLFTFYNCHLFILLLRQVTEVFVQALDLHLSTLVFFILGYVISYCYIKCNSLLSGISKKKKIPLPPPALPKLCCQDFDSG